MINGYLLLEFVFCKLELLSFNVADKICFLGVFLESDAGVFEDAEGVLYICLDLWCGDFACYVGVTTGLLSTSWLELVYSPLRALLHFLVIFHD